MDLDDIRARAAALAEAQAGIVTRRQLLALGLSAKQARKDVTNQRWRSVLRGVYVTFTGPMPPMTRTWAAVLHAGDGAAASHGTALWLGGLLDQPPSTVHVSVPAGRQVKTPAWVEIHRRRGLDTMLQAGDPPRIRLEDALLDAVDECAQVQQAMTLIFTGLQRRLTTPARLRATSQSRLRSRWREVVGGLLADAEAGVVSTLERRYLVDVERRHALPVGERNEPEKDARGRTVYRDVRYRSWRTLVELDGRDAHPRELRARDRQRDNLSDLSGDATLRFGWPEVAGIPCVVAFQVCQMLRTQGWPDWGVPCGPECAVGSPESA